MSAGPSNLLVSAVYVPGVPKVSVEPIFLHLPACSAYQPTIRASVWFHNTCFWLSVCVYGWHLQRMCMCPLYFLLVLLVPLIHLCSI